jgi:hypothetical protein
MLHRARRGGGLPSPIVGWVYNFSVTNYWKVSAFYELDDLFQDGLVCAVKCRNRYGGITDPHLMSLTQTAFSRHLIDLTRRFSAVGDPIYLADLGSDEIAVREKYSHADYPLGELARCVSELPDHLYQIFRYLLVNPHLRVKRRDEHDLRRFLCDC